MIRFELIIMMIIILILIAIINSNNNRVVSPLCECVCVRVFASTCVSLAPLRSRGFARARGSKRRYRSARAERERNGEMLAAPRFARD